MKVVTRQEVAKHPYLRVVFSDPKVSMVQLPVSPVGDVKVLIGSQWINRRVPALATKSFI